SQAASAAARTELLQKLDASTGSARMELIRKEVIEPANSVPAYWFNVYAGGSMSQVNQIENEEVLSPLLPEDRIKLLEEYILNGSADIWLRNAVKQLVYEYDERGNTDNEADKAIAEAVKRFSSNSSTTRELILLRAERALNAGTFTLAEELLRQSEFPVQYNEMELDAKTAWLKGRLLFAQGKGSEALRLVNSALEKYRKDWADIEAEFQTADSSLQGENPSATGPGSSQNSKPAAPEHGVSSTEEQLTVLQAALQTAVDMGFNRPATITGTLTKSDGTPVAGAGIFLRAESELYHSVYYDSEPYQIVTDAEGHFQFSGIVPGFYQIQLGLSFEQIDGWTWPVQSDDWIELKAGDAITRNITLQPLLELKSPVNSQVLTGSAVNFSWEAVKGAAYYSLSTTVMDDGGSFSTVVRQQITDNQVTIPVDELYNSGGFSTSGFSTGSSGEGWQSVSPSSLLGFANPDSKFSWSIDAYDGQGHVITRSNGYRLNEETVGNLPFFYLKSRTLTAADQLVVDKKLEQALGAYRRDYTANPQDAHSLKMLIHLMLAKYSDTKDAGLEDEAMALLRKLVELRPDVSYAFSLADYYYDRSEWENYSKYYAQYLKLNGEEPNVYGRSLNATALMLQARLDEAREQLAISMKEDPSHRFVGSYLAAELAAGQPLSSVLELAERYPQHMYSQGGYTWPLLILKLQAERAGQPEAFGQLMNEKLDAYVSGQHEALEQWTREGNPSALKAFIQAVLEVG
ncbi:carboxypeptidase-like regulatory domain-containing protein, partial [Paenibacillus ihuae]|uniref:carboxypeptidase-like regulatory domain-containing protein n=1 Tax=Paenibacillus ihuae TaxID=1232431 RepID=UPI000D52676C